MRFIEISGEQYPVKFGLSALKKMLAKYDLKRLIDTEELMTKLEPGYIPEALKLGVDNGCRILDKEAPSIKDIQEWFENDLSLMTKTIELLSKDISGEPEQVEDEKKENPEPVPTYKK